MKLDKLTLILASIVFTVGVIAGYSFTRDNPQSVGSVARGGEYLSTTTPNGVTDLFLMKEGVGILGSVNLTGGSTGVLYFYDATTSNVTLRNNVPTSTIRLFVLDGNFGTSTGTFTLDAHFYNGLLLDIEGTAPTTTITWR